MTQAAHCVGMDFGTDSVRAILVNAVNGAEIASATHAYRRWSEGKYCHADQHQFRQHPRDYIESMESVLEQVLSHVESDIRSSVKAISIATTGSTPVAVDRSGSPLSLRSEFSDDPDAMFVLWKDHTAVNEALEITHYSRSFGRDYLKYVGGIYSSEWYWAKLLHILRQNDRLRQHCNGFVEHADWIPFLLTGGSELSELKRNVCTAGHKALWSEAWGGYPPESFFSGLDPLLNNELTGLPKITYTADQQAGVISGEWARRFGLPEDVLIGIGAMDAHMGAVGGQIEPYYLSKVMGTSTCDMLIAPVADLKDKFVQGICGMVEGSIIPGMVGLEAGQSAFGDVYAWFKNLLCWPLKNIPGLPEGIYEEISEKIIPALTKKAAAMPADEDSELSLDWFNGRRTPDANALLKSAITGLDLATDAPAVFRSLVEATCFGARSIVNRFIEQGIPVRGLIGVGGVARKSDFIMQTMADCLNLPIKINKSEQSTALGAAMFAATVAGIYPRVEDAMRAMEQGFEKTFHPGKERVALYEKRYQRYLALGDFVERHST